MSSRFPTWSVLRKFSGPGVLLVDDDALESRARMDVLTHHFRCVERVRSAAEALILLNDKKAARNAKLILVALHRPELAGPDFVRELQERAPAAAVLVIGQAGESAGDYPGEHVHFLPPHVSTGEVLGAARAVLGGRLREAA